MVTSKLTEFVWWQRSQNSEWTMNLDNIVLRLTYVLQEEFVIQIVAAFH